MASQLGQSCRCSGEPQLLQKFAVTAFAAVQKEHFTAL
jgi:hypothetical protein